jgi:ankyrin repeat protein
MQDLAEAELTLASLTNDYAPADLHVTRVTALMNALNGQIDAQMNGVIDGLQTKMEADLNVAKILRDQSGPASAVPTEASPATEDEAREIRRIQQLIQNSPDLINALPSVNDFTPLGDAARMGQIKVATFLLDHGADINVAQRYGMTALHGATRAGNRAMVELLLSRGANVNAKDGLDETALHLALERNFPAVIETLLAAKADVNAADRNGVTPLMLAAKNGNRKLAAAMLALGADPNLQNKISPGSTSPHVEQAGTALHVATARNDAAMVALLLTNHADVKLRSVTGWTPLDVAASAGATEVAAQLIAAGADVNAAGPVDSTGGATPLLRAAGNDHSDTVKLLLEHGANPNTAYITGAGSTPLMLAAGQGNTEIAGLLLEHGARTDLKDNEHNTSLYRAVNRGNVKVVQLLLAHGANPNERNPNGIPLLIVVTADKSNPDLLAAFLKAKADVNAANSSGQTALFYAVRTGRKDLAEMLLAAGADPNLCNLDGQTPLDLARQQSGSSGPDSTSIPAGISSASLADLLRQHGALDNLPRWDRIEVSRPSANFSATALLKGTNDWNQFSLFELLARHYRLLSDDQPRDPPGRIWGSIQKVLRDTLPFPDLRRVQIHRPEADGRKWTSLPIDLEDLLSSGDCARDVALHWGDIVEIPEADHPVADQWKGLGASAWTNLIRCISRTVTIAINGQASNLRLAPVFVENTNEYASIFVEADVLEHGGISIRPEACMLRPVLDQSKRVRFSSDLSRVKVTRLDPKTRKKREWTLDCTGASPAALWLRDGDVIEVPEK